MPQRLMALAGQKPCQHTHEKETDTGARLEKAHGFSVLHTLNLAPHHSPPVTGHTPPERRAQAVTASRPRTPNSMPTQRLTTTTVPPVASTVAATTVSTMPTPPAAKNRTAAQQTSDYKHTGCTPQTRKLLGKTLSVIIEILSGRRPIDNLMALAVETNARAGIRSLAKQGTLKGASLRSFHPNPAASAHCVDFVGTLEITGRVRAFSGRFKHLKKGAKWKLDYFHLV